MKAYLIVAHKEPALLKRLINALDDGESHFFVHLDRRIDKSPFIASLLPWQASVHFLRREKTAWAGYGIVKAILNGLEAVQAAALPFKHVMLISGQDYPVKSNEFISRFTEHHKDDTFIEYFSLPDHDKWKPNGGMYRVNKYFLGMGTLQRLISKTLNFSSRYLPFLQRRAYNEMKPFAGSMWWTMNMRTVGYVLNFVHKNPGYIEFHQYTFAPDEVFFHTILLNADDKLTGRIINTDMRFIKWKDKSSSHPELISAEDMEVIPDSTALFARKFDLQHCCEVLDLIDHYRSTH